MPFPPFEDTPLSFSVSGMKASDEKINDAAYHTDGLPSIADSLPSASSNSKQYEAEVEEENSDAEGEDATVGRTTALPNSKPLKAVSSPTIVVTASTETDESTNGEDEVESRGNMTHFKTCGTLVARNKLSKSIYV